MNIEIESETVQEHEETIDRFIEAQQKAERIKKAKEKYDIGPNEDGWWEENQ